MSMKLQNKYSNGEINIVTREENGCGTSLLVDWAIAWMHLNYHSRAVFLFDNDQAGNNAIKPLCEQHLVFVPFYLLLDSASTRYLVSVILKQYFQLYL